MKQMATIEIQRVSLNILLAIDAFCKQHDIRYFLDSGTLIGAIRHKGFIPWDDDADILMPRPDYERFVLEWKNSEKLRLYAPSRHNCYLHYARVCEMKETFFKQQSIWTIESPGVGVDIFPLDGAPDDINIYDIHSKRITNLRNELWKLRSAKTKRNYSGGFRTNPFGFIKDCIHAISFCCRYQCFNFLTPFVLKRIRTVRLKYPYGDTAHCCSIVVSTGRRKYWDLSWFEKSVDVEFCNHKFPAPIGYDKRLRAEYGDYMQLPPVEKRGNHSSWQTMWWRNA